MPAHVVNDPLAHHLKREVAVLLGSRRTLGLLALVALLAGLSGPFGTYDAMSPSARYLFWALVVAGTATAGHITGSTIEHLLDGRAWPAMPRTLAAAAATAVPVFGVVVVVLLGFGLEPDGAGLISLFAQCTAVVGGVAFLTFPAAPATEQSNSIAGPRILNRLPGARRGRLIRLRARDHYVEVITTSGSTLVSMRFGDAIVEAEPEPGTQVHRSHWVALHAVSGRCRVDSKAGIRLTDGSFVPIGRKFRSAAREIGIR